MIYTDKLLCILAAMLRALHKSRRTHLQPLGLSSNSLSISLGRQFVLKLPYFPPMARARDLR